MNTIEFRLVPGDHGRREDAVGILIDGVSLRDHARAVEQTFADGDGHPDLAGDYAPLMLSEINRSTSHFLGEPELSWFDDGDTVLLGCPCGEWGCWPLTARVMARGDTGVERIQDGPPAVGPVDVGAVRVRSPAV